LTKHVRHQQGQQNHMDAFFAHSTGHRQQQVPQGAGGQEMHFSMLAPLHAAFHNKILWSQVVETHAGIRPRCTEFPTQNAASASPVTECGGVSAGVGANESERRRRRRASSDRQRATNARLGGAGLRLPVSLLLAAARGAPGRRQPHCILCTVVRQIS
jgi:hypothetical protein